jgi:hypothetical protein
MTRPNENLAQPSHNPIPKPELAQADPQLQLSEGRASSLQIAVVAFACLLIIGITLYGLGRPATTDGDLMVSAPPAQETTGAAPADTAAPQTGATQPAPQTGGSVPGGENIAPAGEMPQKIPAKEPVPHLVKPGAVGSDSVR